MNQLSIPTDDDDEPPTPEPNPARYYGTNPTPTERESGEQVSKRNKGPMKPGGRGHQALWAYREGKLMTAYEASQRMSGDHHAIRRDIPRLYYERGFLTKEGTLPNTAPNGRPRVDAYRITFLGKVELRRLGPYKPT